jgi:hypothetical protein
VVEATGYETPHHGSNPGGGTASGLAPNLSRWEIIFSSKFTKKRHETLKIYLKKGMRHNTYFLPYKYR